MPDEEREKHILEQRVPGFLLLLDTEPERAWAEFYTFAWKLLRAHPPRAFAGLRPEARDDLIADLVLACRENDFRVLRLYQDIGLPFGAWFGKTANRRALDLIRRYELEKRTEEILLPRTAPGPDEEVHSVQVLAAVRSCMNRMAEQCQLLLWAASEGYKPAEMVLIIGPPRRDGKQVSDALRSCRKTLRLCLHKQGY